MSTNDPFLSVQQRLDKAETRLDDHSGRIARNETQIENHEERLSAMDRVADAFIRSDTKLDRLLTDFKQSEVDRVERDERARAERVAQRKWQIGILVAVLASALGAFIELLPHF